MKKINFTLGGMLAGLFLISLGIGAFPISLFKTMMGQLAQAESSVFWQIRLPRTCLAAAVGMVLGLSGAAMQGFLRNPLADSGLLGISGGAVLGAMLALYSGVTAWGIWLLPAGGFLGAWAAAALILVFCMNRTSLLGLILAGTALNTFFFATGSLLLNFSKNPYAVLEMMYWQLGSFENRTIEQVFAALPCMFAGGYFLLRTAPALKLLTLGEDVARTSGVSMKKTFNRIILGTALSVGAAVSICGSISFVGLLIPHLMRPVVKHDPGDLLPASALAGGVFMLLADVLCRTAAADTELKIGVLTALLGAPFFIYLAFRAKTQLT